MQAVVSHLILLVSGVALWDAQHVPRELGSMPSLAVTSAVPDAQLLEGGAQDAGVLR